MRICLLVDGFGVLTETFVVNEVEALRGLGQEVTVEAATERAEDGPRRRLADLAWLALRHPVACVADVLARPRWRREEWAPPLRELAPVARRIARRGDEHLHAHFATGPALTALRLGRLLGLPYSVTAHAWDIFLAPANLREKLERAAVAFTVCEYNARHLRAIAPESRLETVVMGVDPTVFRRTGPLPGGRTVLAVGRLVEKKGFEVLAAAIRQLPGVRLRIVGEGPLRDALATPGVELLGARPPAEVRELMEEADLLAMPCVVASDGDRDSMPVVVKEAMAMELLIAASDEVGLPECVAAPWGRLVRPCDPEALAAAIAELLELGPAQRAAAGAAGRAWVLEHADVRTETARVLAAITRAARDTRR